MATQRSRIKTTGSEYVKDLNSRLEAVGWALFLILVGMLWLLPNEQEPRGGLLLGVGGIMTGINVARYWNGIPVSGFTTILGIGALLSGSVEFLGTDLEFIPMVLILIGAGIILKPLFESKATDRDRID